MMPETLATQIEQIAQCAREAGCQLSAASTEQKNDALKLMASHILRDKNDILEANKIDVNAAKKTGCTDAILDRLTLNSERIESMAAGVTAIAELDDPVGVILKKWDRPNGLQIRRVSVPLGVIGVIYEARPNVTTDAGALCLKSGNAVILRGGSNSFHSATAIMQSIRSALSASKLPENSVQMIATTSRDAVGILLQQDKYIDVIIPRGGHSLIQRISDDSKIPLFKHLQGLCHTYIHTAADAEMATNIVINAKMRRTGICGATETILIDSDIVNTVGPKIINVLLEQGCEVRGGETIRALNSKIKAATSEDWDTEYLDSIVSIKAVNNINEAIAHINVHGSQHTDAIITQDLAAAEQFLNQVDSAITMHNTSTQFADGGEFGMGAEIGIATGKLHARGPVGLEQLTTFKYQVFGSGQIR